MPEGDTIFRTAERLRAALLGEKILRFATNMPELRGARIAGRHITAAHAHGKHLYITFDDGRVLHSHMQMHGMWRIYARTEKSWEKRVRFARVLIETCACAAACFRAPVIELVTAHAAEVGARSLGPNLLADEFDEDRAVAGLRALSDRPLGVAVMSQRAVAGIGNIYKSESLFAARENPFALVRDVSDARLRAILGAARALMMKSALGRSAVRELRRSSEPGGSRWVYRRDGKPCFVCGARLSMRRQGEDARSTYFCGSCQRVG